MTKGREVFKFCGSLKAQYQFLLCTVPEESSLKVGNSSNNNINNAETLKKKKCML